MNEYKHWCGNCQIRIYFQRHYGRTLTWHDCPYTCKYATEMRCSTTKGEPMPEWIVKEDPDIDLGMHGRAKIGVLGGTIQDELIRCKECKHYNAGFECLIEGYGIERDKNWYCGDAERRCDE